MKKLPEHQMIFKSEKAFQNDMDIANIIKKIHDLEKLKILLLNEDQLLLFNHLSKPLITFDQEEPVIIGRNIRKSNLKMSRLMNFSCITKTGSEIEQSYKRVMEGKKSDKINQRLIELLD